MNTTDKKDANASQPEELDREALDGVQGGWKAGGGAHVKQPDLEDRRLFNPYATG